MNEKLPGYYDEEGGTCNVCGGGIRYGERHYRCGEAVLSLETRLRAAEAKLAADQDWIDKAAKTTFIKGGDIPETIERARAALVARCQRAESERDQARATIATLTSQLAEAQRDAERLGHVRQIVEENGECWFQLSRDPDDRALYQLYFQDDEHEPLRYSSIRTAIDAAMKDTHGNG